jgi:hypothetical protein
LNIFGILFTKLFVYQQDTNIAQSIWQKEAIATSLPITLPCEKKYKSNIKCWRQKSNFTQDDVKSLEETHFFMNKQQHIHLQNLFGGKNFVPINWLMNVIFVMDVNAMKFIDLNGHTWLVINLYLTFGLSSIHS